MLTWLVTQRSKILNRQYLMSNINAGVIVGIVTFPLAMAFAIASGARPEQGIYTAIVAGVAGAMFGGSQVQISGPTGAFIVILSGITAEYGITGLQIATLMGGGILLLMAKMKLGNLLKYIPSSVILGFTTGIALLIFFNGWKDFFGLQLPRLGLQHFHERLWALFQALPSCHANSSFLGALTLVILFVLPKFTKRIPASLAAILIVSLTQAYFQFADVTTIGKLFGNVPKELPHLQFPSCSVSQCLDLLGPAISIALLCAIESLLSATVADGLAGTSSKPNQELIGQGVTNILSPLFGGFASTGAIARTALNVRSGGNAPLASIVQAIILMIVMIFAAPLLNYIPMPVLAAILFTVAYSMADFPHVFHMLKKSSFKYTLVLTTTFVLTIFTDLVIAVFVGVMLSITFKHTLASHEETNS